MVVLLDLLMPRVNGVDVLWRVPVEGECLSRHIYLVSTGAANIIPQLQPLLEAVGASALPRPFDIDVLASAVAQAARRLDAVATRRQAALASAWPRWRRPL
jgi:CheY-like chemotaxis protein